MKTVLLNLAKLSTPSYTSEIRKKTIQMKLPDTAALALQTVRQRCTPEAPHISYNTNGAAVMEMNPAASCRDVAIIQAVIKRTQTHAGAALWQLCRRAGRAPRLKTDLLILNTLPWGHGGRLDGRNRTAYIKDCTSPQSPILHLWAGTHMGYSSLSAPACNSLCLNITRVSCM